MSPFPKCERSIYVAFASIDENGAVNVLLEAEESALAHLAFPATHRTRIRTNNVQERAHRKIKRRANVVQGFPSCESLIHLVGAALIEVDEEWLARCVISRPSLAHDSG